EYRGRIKVICSGITGDEEAELPSWVEPALDWGFFLVPDVDEVVEVEMLMATPRDEVRGESGMLDPQLRWRGVRVWDSSETDQPRPVPDDFKANYKRRGFATPAGHVLYFDDTDGATLVCLTWCDGADQPKKSSLLFDTDGTI